MEFAFASPVMLVGIGTTKYRFWGCKGGAFLGIGSQQYGRDRVPPSAIQSVALLVPDGKCFSGYVSECGSFGSTEGRVYYVRTYHTCHSFLIFPELAVMLLVVR